MSDFYGELSGGLTIRVVSGSIISIIVADLCPQYNYWCYPVIEDGGMGS